MNEQFLDEVISSVSSYVVSVKLSYTNPTNSASTSTMETKVFAPSAFEMGRVADQYANAEGAKISYFGSTSDAVALDSSGAAQPYWTRTANKLDSSGIFFVSNAGSPQNPTNYNSPGVYVRPFFVLSPNTPFVENEDGTYSFSEDSSPVVSFSFTVPHGTQPVVRQYTYNYEEHYQTMLEGGVLPALGGDTGPTYSEVLSENTWAQIAQAVADKDPILDVWQVGDTKDEVISGETLTFAIMGKNMDDLADGSGKAGLTFGMTQLMANTRQMNSSNTNSGSFAGSAMYSWLSGTIYPNLPTELKDAIKAVNKKTSSGGGSSSIRTDAMYLWLFSEIEVFGTTTYSYAGEGTQYPYFATSAERIKRLSNGAGAASYWWERSPHRGSDYYFCRVDASGSAGNTGASLSHGVCFGFCI